MTSEEFSRLIVSDEVVTRIKGYRQRLPELDLLKQRVSELREKMNEANNDALRFQSLRLKKLAAEMKSELKKLQARAREISSLKTGLPVLMYQATFAESVSKKGYVGTWRKQSAAILNGLFMLDIDHVDDIKQCLLDMQDRNNMPTVRELCEHFQILLIHVTPSGRGLRMVAVADAERGNLADNQQWLAKELGVEPDIACKDASRCSFCPMFDDIIYIDNEKLFNYENPEYNEKFGDQYRRGNSQPLASRSSDNNHNPIGNSRTGNGRTAQLAGPEVKQDAGLVEWQSVSSQNVDVQNVDVRLKEGYHGKSYYDICEKWFECNGGKPAMGDRHRCLLSLASDLRYISDNNAHLLQRILEECSVGREIVDEGNGAELAAIASGACGRQLWKSIPKRFQPVLSSLGILEHAPLVDKESRAQSEIDYEYWWQRLSPLLADSPGFREVVEPLPEHHRLAGVLAAGAMMGTYLTRCWWEHFDGKDYRLSFLVYIIGGAASGKSFVPRMDALLMAPMMAADRVGREWERQYKEEMKKRAASSKNAKADAPEQRHPVIRYVPSTISNAMLYRRLIDAVDENAMGPDGQPMHLHVYTCEAELATALRAQQGSWAGKLDLECKSFQNEVAGVDYANDQSVNGIIQVNWNQVVTGTPDAMARKIRPATVLDGLATRLVLFPMPANDYAMIEKRRAIRDHDRECYLRSVGLQLEDIKGELKADRLVDFCYEYEEKLAKDAEMEQDLCLDYFRKRIPLIMMRYTLVRMVMRQLKEARTGQPLEVLDSDLEFARLIGDFCLASQMHFFGQMVMDALDNESKTFVPRRRSRKVREMYAMLPPAFSVDALVEKGFSKSLSAARVIIHRWREDGLIKQDDNADVFIKNFKEIPE